MKKRRTVATRQAAKNGNKKQQMSVEQASEVVKDKITEIHIFDTKPQDTLSHEASDKSLTIEQAKAMQRQ